MISIANHAHADGTNSYPSFNTIAREGHLSRSEVIRSIPELEMSGELSVAREAGPHGTNMYSLPRFMEDRRNQLVAKRDQSLVASDAQLVASGVQASRQKRPEPSFNRTEPNTRATVWPVGLSLSQKLKEYAVLRGLEFPEFEWEKFENHHRSRGTKFKDWDRAWFTWVGRVPEFSGTRNRAPLSDIQGAPRGTPRKNYQPARIVN